MHNELRVLQNLAKTDNATQRDIANYTGISLGNVNIIIKRLFNKGLVKLERINARTVRYILTPRGLRERAEATYRFIVDSCRMINDIHARLDAAYEDMQCEKTAVCLYGTKDEMHRLISDYLNNKGIALETVQNYEELCAFMAARNGVSGNSYTIITWHPDYSIELLDKKIKHIDILEKL